MVIALAPKCAETKAAVVNVYRLAVIIANIYLQRTMLEQILRRLGYQFCGHDYGRILGGRLRAVANCPSPEEPPSLSRRKVYHLIVNVRSPACSSILIRMDLQRQDRPPPTDIARDLPCRPSCIQR